jgi:hypothetical protein
LTSSGSGSDFDNKIHKIYCKYEFKNVNEENQIHNFISSAGSGTVTNYGSGSDFSTSYGYGTA